MYNISYIQENRWPQPLSKYLILTVPDECYSRNASCAL